MNTATPPRICWCFVAVVSSAAAIAIAILGPKMSPIRDGNADEFWRLAAGVNLRPAEYERRGYAYYPEYGWVAYTLSHMHGSDLYRVRESDILTKFESVKLSLLEASELGEDTPFVQGFHEWQSLEPPFRTPNQLFYAIRRAQREAWTLNDGLSLTVSDQEENSFWRRWRQLKWFWANFVFEWFFITGLALFIAWPGIAGMSIYRWAAHSVVTPLLFMLPTYLGYASYSYTSAGLSGGIVYPYLLRVTFGGRCNRWDRWLLEHCPQILEPLSAPIGEWMSLSGGGMPGPTSMLEFGVMIAVAIVVATWVWRWFSTKMRSNQQPATSNKKNTSELPQSSHR